MWSKVKSIFYKAPVTETAWREPFVWNEELETKLLGDISELKPDPRPSILILGPMNAGKSSFVNSMLSVAKRRKVDIAQTGAQKQSFTLTYEQYPDDSLLKHFSLRDCRGIEPFWNEGCCEEDIMCVLKGHIMNGYEFRPTETIKEDHVLYRRNPDFKDQIHCVVYLVDIKIINTNIKPEYLENIKRLQAKVKKLGIPRVLILTKADTLCKEVEKDISKMFYSVKIQEAVRLASEMFSIPQASIHPIKNYEHEIELYVKKNVQILLAMRQILHYADDWVAKYRLDTPARMEMQKINTERTKQATIQTSDS